MKNSLFLVAIFFMVFIAKAQVKQTIDTILVTASRVKTTIENSTRSISVITAEQLQQLPVQSIDEALRYVIGLNVNTRGAFGVQADIGIRGSTFSQVLVLLDNVRINDPLTAHFNSNIPLSMAEIDRIEIIRGPAAASFGADAVGGVIHIKTKAYTAQLNTASSFQFEGAAAFGEHKLGTTDAGFVSKKNKWLISGGLRLLNSEGERLQNPNFGIDPSADSLYNNFFDLKNYSLAATHFINEHWKVYARFGFDFRDFKAKFFYTNSNFDESEERISNHWTQMAIVNETDKSATEFNARYSRSEDLFTFNPAFAPNEHQMFSTVLNINHLFKFNAQHQLAIGGQLWNRKIESTDRGNHEDLSIGAYAVYDYVFSNRWKANFGARVENDDNYGTEFIPQLSLLYSKEKLRLRASAGKAVRAADFTERFVSFNIPNLTPGRNIGNPDLKAEKSWSYDLGVNYQWDTNTALSGSVFFRDSDNLIDFVTTNSNDINNINSLLPDENYFYAQNIAGANTFGFELNFQKQWESNNGFQFQTNLGYTFLETNQDGNLDSKAIANHPQHNVIFNALVKFQQFGISFNGNYINRDQELINAINGNVQSDYLLLNATLSGYIYEDTVQLFVNMWNITDERYQEILGAQNPGRWISGGLKWNFKL